MHEIDWTHEGDVTRGELFIGDPWPWTNVTVKYWDVEYGWEVVLVDDDGDNMLSLGVYATAIRAMDALTAFRSKLHQGRTRVAFRDDLSWVTQVELVAKVTRLASVSPLVDQPIGSQPWI